MSVCREKKNKRGEVHQGQEVERVGLGGDGLTALYISSQTKFLDFRYYLKHRFFNHFFFLNLKLQEDMKKHLIGRFIFSKKES